MTALADPRIAAVVDALDLPDDYDPEVAADIIAAIIGSLARHLTPEVEAQLAARGIPLEQAVAKLAHDALVAVINSRKDA